MWHIFYELARNRIDRWRKVPHFIAETALQVGIDIKISIFPPENFVAAAPPKKEQK